MSHVNESCHIWRSHVTYEWVMSCMSIFASMTQKHFNKRLYHSSMIHPFMHKYILFSLIWKRALFLRGLYWKGLCFKRSSMFEGIVWCTQIKRWQWCTACIIHPSMYTHLLILNESRYTCSGRIIQREFNTRRCASIQLRRCRDRQKHIHMFIHIYIHIYL